MSDAAVVRAPVALTVMISVAFISCWASGYIAARFTKELFTPFNLLFARYVVTIIALLAIVIWKNGSDTGRAIRREMTTIQVVLGILYHAAYIGGVFYAVKLGLSAGVAAVILATQPLATTMIECGLRRTVPSGRLMSGAAICIAGTAILSGITGVDDLSTDMAPLMVAGLAVLAISVATIVHAKSVQSMDVWPALLVQFMSAALAVALLLISGVEQINITINSYTFVVVLFLVFVTTIGSYVSMNWLIANMETETYSLLFYLVPPTVFFMEFVIFNGTISLKQLLGCVVALFGVYISLSGKPKIGGATG